MSGYKPVKTYTVDLDKPADQRWSEISIEYANRIKKVLKYCESILGNLNYSASWISWLFSNYVFYIDELRGISKDTGIEISQLILMQLCYEVCACCTSIIIDKEDNTYHYRTMDWAMEELKDITIQVRFVKNDKEIYQAVCWAGYVGILTGVRKDIASVSLNYRRTVEPSIMDNLYSMIGGSWPAGFLIRHALETADSTEQIFAYLSNSDLISPCYIIVNGAETGTGKVIVRERFSTNKKIKLSSNSQFIAQTNIDYDRLDDPKAPNILMSRERLSKVDELIQNHNDSIIDTKSIIKLFDTYPIINHETIYVCVMDCASGEIITYVVI